MTKFAVNFPVSREIEAERISDLNPAGRMCRNEGDSIQSTKDTFIMSSIESML
jgi:hypothetical protein